MELKELKQQLILQLSALNNNEWHTCNITFQFPPTINKGYKANPVFLDKENRRLRLFLPINQGFDEILYDFIAAMNRDGKYNQINFSAERGKLEEAAISVAFSQEIVSEFENNLPQSQRGKTIPWWKGSAVN